jgi:hypothetical protein
VLYSFRGEATDSRAQAVFRYLWTIQPGRPRGSERSPGRAGELERLFLFGERCSEPHHPLGLIGPCPVVAQLPSTQTEQQIALAPGPRVADVFNAVFGVIVGVVYRPFPISETTSIKSITCSSIDKR